MDRESLRTARLRMWWEAGMSWGTRLLAWAWIAALVFVAGMVLGGMLREGRGHTGPPVPQEQRPQVSVVTSLSSQ